MPISLIPTIIALAAPPGNCNYNTVGRWSSVLRSSRGNTSRRSGSAKGEAWRRGGRGCAGRPETRWLTTARRVPRHSGRWLARMAGRAGSWRGPQPHAEGHPPPRIGMLAGVLEIQCGEAPVLEISQPNQVDEGVAAGPDDLDVVHSALGRQREAQFQLDRGGHILRPEPGQPDLGQIRSQWWASQELAAACRAPNPDRGGDGLCRDDDGRDGLRQLFLRGEEPGRQRPWIGNGR